jgi:hypothetical protein
MGIVTFTYQIPAKSIGGFEIDCFLTEHISHSNSITDIPVEDGDNIADHVIENADEIQVKAFIGSAVFEALEGKMPENPGDIPKEDRKARIKQAYLELLRLKRERQPVDVVMGLATFKNMVIATFDIDRDAETGADLPFDMSFKSVRIVKSETTTINASSTGAAGDQVAGTSNAGTVGSNKVDPESNMMQQEWIQAGEKSGWSYPTREEYLETCERNKWTP